MFQLSCPLCTLRGRSFLRLIGIEIVLLGIGRALGLVTEAGKAGWYDTLARSALTPPGWVFGLVWTILYLMIGLALWRLYERRAALRDPAQVFALFAAQMALNWGWTPLFFTAHWLFLSFLWLLALVSMLCALLSVLWHEDRVSAWLLVPYALWCAFATYLSGAIWLFN